MIHSIIRSAIVVWMFFYSADIYAAWGRTRTFGVDIHLTSGPVQTGYMFWNPDEGGPFSDFLIKTNLALSGDGEFHRFISYEKSITLYKRFGEIKFPVNATVAIKEEILSVPLDSITEIRLNPSLKLDLNGDNLSTLTNDEIKRLQKKPAYIFSEETGLGGTLFYVATDGSIPPMEFLRHLVAEGARPLFLNEERIIINEYHFGRYNLNCSGIIASDLEACEQFRKEWEQFQDNPHQVELKECLQAADKVFALVRSATDYQSAYRDASVKEAYRKCKEIETSLRKKARFEKPSPENLQKWKIIPFSL